MSDSQTIKNLERRIEILEARVITASEEIISECKECNFSESLSSFETEEVEALQSKKWVGGAIGGRCEHKDNAVVLLFTSGAVRMTGRRRCNAGNIQSCKFDIDVEFKIGNAVIATFRVASGVVGPRDEDGYEYDDFDPVLKAEYNNVNTITWWRRNCRVGI